jgi:hypothetical protein
MSALCDEEWYDENPEPTKAQQKAKDREFSGFWFVNVYDRDREYGGPEEGGWWYDTGRFLKSRPCRTKAEANKIVERWQRFLDAVHNQPRGPRANLGSVLCEGKLCCSIQTAPGVDFPESRPFYE